MLWFSFLYHLKYNSFHSYYSDTICSCCVIVIPSQSSFQTCCRYVKEIDFNNNWILIIRCTKMEQNVSIIYIHISYIYIIYIYLYLFVFCIYTWIQKLLNFNIKFINICSLVVSQNQEDWNDYESIYTSSIQLLSFGMNLPS